jgi:shikimate dehydrogenase
LNAAASVRSLTFVRDDSNSSVKEIYTFADLKTWRKRKPSIRLGIFGSPVAQSLSPQIQNAALKASKIDMQYARFEIAPNELGDALQFARDHEFIGINLTLPHKVSALALIDDVDASAKRIVAVNTIKIDNGKLRGFNTDGKGFARAIREEFVVDLRDLRVMILGAGGAARAIALQCAKEHCERLVIASRTFGKGQALTNDLREFFIGPKVLGPVPRLHAIPWEESAFRFQFSHIDLVVNATPIGLGANDQSPIPTRLLEPHLMIYDTVYAQDRQSALVKAAHEAGARGANGLSMLLHQGALAFEIWFGREAPLEAMRAAL